MHICTQKNPKDPWVVHPLFLCFSRVNNPSFATVHNHRCCNNFIVIRSSLATTPFACTLNPRRQMKAFIRNAFIPMYALLYALVQRRLSFEFENSRTPNCSYLINLYVDKTFNCVVYSVLGNRNRKISELNISWPTSLVTKTLDSYRLF